MSEIQDFILPAQLIDRAREVLEANRLRGKRIVVAESCTGGLISGALTEISGSSDVFQAGYVTYSNESKMAMLGVSQDVLETFGAVSIAVAWGMAQGALARSGADVAVAITGIAGSDREGRTVIAAPTSPGGKPVGTVCFAFAGPKSTKTVTKLFSGGRERIRRAAAYFALDLARKHFA